MNQLSNNHEYDLECVEVLLKYSEFSLKSHIENFNTLDSKASTLAGFIGIIIALSAAFLSTNFHYLGESNIRTLKCLPSIINVLFPISVISLFLAFLFCLITLRVRNIKSFARTDVMISHYKKLGDFQSRKPQMLKDIIKSLGSSEKSYIKTNKKKSKSLATATIFLFIAAASGGCGLLLIFLIRLVKI